MIVSTPIGVKIIASTKYVNCEVMVGEMETSIDLIKGEMEFDAILGMDWWSACGAHVDCNRKRIIFKIEGVSFSSFMFQKEAEHWWRAVKNCVKNTRESIT